MSGNRTSRRPYPPEFKREAVELYRRSGKSVVAIATEIGVAPESLRTWNLQHEIDIGEREGLSSSERERLRELERENARLRMERDLLKRAAAFFAKETRQPAGLWLTTRLLEKMVERSNALGDLYRMTGSLMSIDTLLLEQRVELDSRAVDEDERAERIAALRMRRSLKARDLRPRVRPPAVSVEPDAVGSSYQSAGVVAA